MFNNYSFLGRFFLKQLQRKDFFASLFEKIDFKLRITIYPTGNSKLRENEICVKAKFSLCFIYQHFSFSLAFQSCKYFVNHSLLRYKVCFIFYYCACFYICIFHKIN